MEKEEDVQEQDSDLEEKGNKNWGWVIFFSALILLAIICIVVIKTIPID